MKTKAQEIMMELKALSNEELLERAKPYKLDVVREEISFYDGSYQKLIDMAEEIKKEHNLSNEELKVEAISEPYSDFYRVAFIFDRKLNLEDFYQKQSLIQNLFNQIQHEKDEEKDEKVYTGNFLFSKKDQALVLEKQNITPSEHFPEHQPFVGYIIKILVRNHICYLQPFYLKKVII